MNPRIRELAQKAYFHGDDIWLHSDRLEKFAELIVRECADQCMNVLDHHAILERFGVEE
jgi:hypothetical protein